MTNDNIQERDEVQAAIDGLHNEEWFFRKTREELEDAESMRDVARVYRKLLDWESGDYPKHSSENWAVVRMKDLFREQDVWEDENNRPDYDKVSSEHFENE